LPRLAEHLIHFEQDAELAHIRLNTLLGQSPRTQIAVVGDSAAPTRLPGPEELERLALASRPDLAQAQAILETSRKQRALAGRSYTPDLSVSAGYTLLPSGSEFRNNYMIEGSINLPWLNRRKHDAEIAEATAKVSEQDAELVAMRNAAFGQIQEALAQAAAAQKLVDVYQRSLRPQADATLRSTVIAYENDRADFLNLLDSQTTVLDIDLAYFQVVADFQARLADLELAVGSPIERAPEPTPEVVR
jgi:outer membrane protein, heavy metal efflux system